MIQFPKFIPVLLLTAILSGAALLSLSTGCGSEPEKATPSQAPVVPDTPISGGTLVLGYNSDIPGFNEVATTSSQPSTEILLRLFIRLMDEQPDFQEKPPTFEPRLAKSYEWSDDHKILTFHLRTDVFWSDGVPITAEDVRWTWEAQTSPEIAWDSVGMKEKIIRVEAPEPHTVEFHFTHSYPGQLVHANEGGILPKHAWSKLPFSEWRKNSQWFVDNLVVSGPFTLESWKPQEEIVLKRNARYYEKGLPLVDRVVFRIIPDMASQLAQLRSGVLDYVRQVPARSAKGLEEEATAKLVAFWPPQFGTVIWNLRNPLFKEASVRRALALGLDRQTIVDTIWHGQARPAESPIISTVWGHDPNLEPLPYDPTAAAALLAEQGWTDTDGDGVLDKQGQSFAFHILANAGNQERIDAAVMIQDQLRKIGVKAQPLTLEWNSLDEKMTGGRFDAVIMGLGLETTLDVSAYFGSESINSELNFGAYSNREVDELLAKIRSQLKLEDAKPHLYRLQRVLRDEQPQTLLWESKRLVGLSRRVQGANPNPIGTLDGLRYWWLYPQRR